MDDHDHPQQEPCRFLFYYGDGFEQSVDPAGRKRLLLSQAVLVQRAVDKLVREHGFSPRYALEVLADQAQDWFRTVPEQAARIISGRA